jgi:4-hydroxybenzoate polyprenyltransferase
MLNNLKSYLESLKVTPLSWLLGVSGVLMVRFFLESLSNPTSSGFFASDASTLIHYYLFFMTGFLILLVLLPILLPEWKKLTPQLVALSAVVTLMPPIIDWLVSGGAGFKMTYLFNGWGQMPVSFLTLGGLSISHGATIGLKIEIGLGLIFFAILIYFLKKSWWRAVFSALVIYLAVFILAELPSIISLGDPINFLQKTFTDSHTLANNLHGTLLYSGYVRFFEIAFNFLMGKILFLVCTTLLFVWANMNYKQKLKAILQNFRAERVSAYVLMIFLGILIAYKTFLIPSLNWADWLSIITLCLSLVFSCLFAICANDMADTDTDKVSNQKRPLISNSLSPEDMKQMGAIFLLASLISGFLAGYLSFFFILTFTSLYYVYSVPPMRLKLIPFLSSFLISLCMLTVILAGFFMVSPVKTVSAASPSLILAVVLIFSLLANVREMKDVAGDTTAGIKTIPVLFGEIWGPRIVAIFASVAFLLIPFFSKIYLLFIPAAMTALFSFYLITKKPYSEKPIDTLYFAFMFISFLLLLI